MSMRTQSLLLLAALSLRAWTQDDVPLPPRPPEDLVTVPAKAEEKVRKPEPKAKSEPKKKLPPVNPFDLMKKDDVRYEYFKALPAEDQVALELLAGQIARGEFKRVGKTEFEQLSASSQRLLKTAKYLFRDVIIISEK